MDMNALVGYLDDIVLYGVAAVGAASLVCQGIAKITKVTPSKKDDQYLEGAQRVLARIQAFLDRMALNPNKAEARK